MILVDLLIDADDSWNEVVSINRNKNSNETNESNDIMIGIVNDNMQVFYRKNCTS